MMKTFDRHRQSNSMPAVVLLQVGWILQFDRLQAEGFVAGKRVSGC